MSTLQQGLLVVAALLGCPVGRLLVCYWRRWRLRQAQAELWRLQVARGMTSKRLDEWMGEGRQSEQRSVISEQSDERQERSASGRMYVLLDPPLVKRPYQFRRRMIE